MCQLCPTLFSRKIRQARKFLYETISKRNLRDLKSELCVSTFRKLKIAIYFAGRLKLLESKFAILWKQFWNLSWFYWSRCAELRLVVTATRQDCCDLCCRKKNFHNLVSACRERNVSKPATSPGRKPLPLIAYCSQAFRISLSLRNWSLKSLLAARLFCQKTPRRETLLSKIRFQALPTEPKIIAENWTWKSQPKIYHFKYQFFPGDDLCWLLCQCLKSWLENFVCKNFEFSSSKICFAGKVATSGNTRFAKLLWFLAPKENFS